MKYLLITAFTLSICMSSVQAQDEKILPVAQEMPTLPECAQITDYGARRKCADEKITRIIADHLEYPEAAKTAGVEGDVVVRFVVDEKGKADDFRVLEDPGYGMADAAIKAVKKIGKWSPGKNRGEPVKVLMSVPVKFKLPEKPEAPAAAPDVYVVVDQMPRFQGCNVADDADARKCTFNNVLNYMRSQMAYPEEAQKQNITGTVIVKFIVDDKGAVTHATVKQGIGGGCDEEALRLVNAMPVWTPGVQGGKPVKVEMTLPVKFAITTAKE